MNGFSQIHTTETASVIGHPPSIFHTVPLLASVARIGHFRNLAVNYFLITLVAISADAFDGKRPVVLLDFFDDPCWISAIFADNLV